MRATRRTYKHVSSQTPADRFFAKVMPDPSGSGCLLWIGTKNSGGYGQFTYCGRNCPAHRWILERASGGIPDHLWVDHLCRNRACVRPSHLEIVTKSENIKRGEAHIRFREMQAAKTHCKRGHPFIPENVYMYLGRYRKCRECGRIRDRARRRRGAKRS